MAIDVIKEACVENFSEVKNSVLNGANRIELNDNMKDWGTTPSFGNIKQTIEYCNKHDIPVVVMNRPRGGNFNYSDNEKEIIKADLDIIITSGATGVAFGALNKAGELDKKFLEKIIDKATKGDLEITFHRAFDSIPYELQKDSLLWLAEQGVNRIATHGGSNSSNIMDNVKRLKELSELDNHLLVMAGGGVNKENYEQLVDQSGVSEVHGTKIV